MVDVKELALRILDLLHESEQRQGQSTLPIAGLYKAFEKEAAIDTVQQAIKYLVDRDLIAPYSYSLTAKGRRERALRPKA